MKPSEPEHDAQPDGAGPAAGLLPRLRLRHHEERRIRSGHLWVFSNEVDTAATPLTAFAPGQLAQLRSDSDRFIGYAYVNPRSLISARLLSRDANRAPGRELIRARLLAALELRSRIRPAPFYRLVFGESDLLPGLVIDRYGEVCVVQIATAGMEAMRDDVLAVLAEVIAPAGVLLKNDSAARDLEGLERYVSIASGQVPEQVEVSEAGLALSAPLAAGQKTGWFYDQSDNRARFLALARGAPRILDVFGYVGAWGIHAAHGTGAQVTLVDASAAALEFGCANAKRHAVALEPRRGDAFQVMTELAAAGAEFDLVIVDPPAFIKRRKDLAKGQAAYRRLNQLAMQLVARGGFLVSCSCSYHLEEATLLEALQRGASLRGCQAQVLAVGGQSADHPIHPAIPETRYLKGFLCRLARD